MRRAVLIVTVAVIAAACSASKHIAQPVSSTAASLAPTPTITAPANLAVARVSSTPAQVIDGFGASGAWWPNDLVKFPAAQQSLVSKLLFSPSGIELSGYRYNIGGGGIGVTTPDRAEKQPAADTAGLTFLRAASAAHVPILTGFVNSAPPQFTTNGKSCGGDLKPGSEAAYGQYLETVVAQLHDRDHITLRYVSPMNEPDNSFGSCGQEGMAVPVAQRARVVQAVGKALLQQTPYAIEIADETTADVILASEAPHWLSVPGTQPYVAAIAHHTYDFPTDALRRLLPPLAKRFSIPTWMTEICCYKGSGGVATSFGSQYDPTMKQGFWLADQIYDDLTVAGDGAWYWWTAVSPVLGCDPTADARCPTTINDKGSNDGLLYYDPAFATNGDTRIFTTKRLYVLGQFSRYVRPGAVRYNVSGAPAGTRVMAFRHDAKWTVVVWNERTTAATLGVSLFGAPVPAESAVETSPTDQLTPTALPSRTNTGAWVVHLEPQSIVTYTFG